MDWGNREEWMDGLWIDGCKQQRVFYRAKLKKGKRKKADKETQLERVNMPTDKKRELQRK